MSKPTKSYFCVHTGYFRNDRTLALFERIGEQAFYVMPMIWSWAGEQQMDGKVAHLSTSRFQKIFEGCHLKLSIPRVRKIVNAIRDVGFIQKGRLHSWEKFNRHAVEYEERLALKRHAAFSRWKSWAENPQHHRGGNGGEDKPDKPSQQLWMIEMGLKYAKGKARKDLLKQREALLSEHTGIDLSEPAAPAPQRHAPARKFNPGEFERASLNSGRLFLKDNQPDLLTEAMVIALVNAGDDLPAAVRAKFAKQIKEARNPIPG